MKLCQGKLYYHRKLCVYDNDSGLFKFCKTTDLFTMCTFVSYQCLVLLRKLCLASSSSSPQHARVSCNQGRLLGIVQAPQFGTILSV